MILAPVLSMLFTATTYATQLPLAIQHATPNRTELACYQLFELSLALTATFDNPFDPNDVDVYALFKGPNNKTIRVNGFYTRNFKRDLRNENEHIASEGDPFWQIRFAPPAEGTWHYQVFARDRSGETSLPECSFSVKGASRPGYIRCDTKSPNLFAPENRDPLFLIGENMCWAGKGGTYTFEDWMSALAQHGGNWVRLWMTRWCGALEWSANDKPEWETFHFDGLGVYHLANAWKMDQIFDIADRHGLYVMLCLGTYGEFTEGGFFNEGLWKTNPFNAANGGPCNTPEAFWTDKTAQTYYKQKLRYLAARYGWRTNLFAWEFWNEAKPPIPWITEMAQYLKSGIDPAHHLISTTYGTDELWKHPDIDFTMTHTYGEGNVGDVDRVVQKDAHQHLVFNKPHLMAEFGIDWRSSDDKYDPAFQGTNLHNAIWASALSLNAGSAMIWYWDSYIHPGNLYGQFAALRKFTDKVPWADGPWRSLSCTILPQPMETETFRDLALTAAGMWGKSPENEFAVSPLNGVGNRLLPFYHYADSKANMRVPLSFQVDYPANGRFEFKLNTVSTEAHLQIRLDGKVIMDKVYSAQPPKHGEPAEYTSTKQIPEYDNIYQAEFNKVYGVDVPKGKHAITLSLLEGDWVSIAEYRFTHYISNAHPPLSVYGITNGSNAYAWIHHNDATWLADKEQKAITPVQKARITVENLPDGTVSVQWWNTWEGTILRTESVPCSGNKLTLTLPEIRKDLAVMMTPVKP